MTRYTSNPWGGSECFAWTDVSRESESSLLHPPTGRHFCDCELQHPAPQPMAIFHDGRATVSFSM
jgi:hypothetical protein